MEIANYMGPELATGLNNPCAPPHLPADVQSYYLVQPYKPTISVEAYRNPSFFNFIKAAG